MTMIRHFFVLQILLLSSVIGETLANFVTADAPSITGNPSELNPEQSRVLRGALRGRQSGGRGGSGATKGDRKARGLQGGYYSGYTSAPPPEEGM